MLQKTSRRPVVRLLGRRRLLAVTMCIGSLLAPMLTASAADAADDKQACVTASDEAQKFRDERKLTQAREQMLLCARESCPGVVRKDCLQWLSEVEASVPSVVLGARNAQGGDISAARVSVDGTKITDKLDGKSIFVDPGPHTFKFEVEGQPAVEQQAVIREGERNRAITATFGAAAPETPITSPVTPAPTEPDKKSAPVAGYIVGGVGVLALGGFAYFGLTGKSDVSTLRDGCGQTHSCAQDDVDSAKSKLIVADVSLGVGIVALGVATYLILTHRSASSTAKVGAGGGAGRPLELSGLSGLSGLSARALPGGGAATLGGRF
jgi:hypothetical protein